MGPCVLKLRVIREGDFSTLWVPYKESDVDLVGQVGPLAELTWGDATSSPSGSHLKKEG